MTRRPAPLMSLLFALLLVACATPPPVAPAAPALELPAGVELPAIATDWWRAFGDAQLDALVEEVLRDNRDLARALARIDESRAALRVAQADQAPRFSANAAAGRERVSGNSAAGAVGPLVSNDFRLGLNVAYEVDLWSRLAQASGAARDELLATVYARDTLLTALSAQAVLSYANLLSLDAQRRLYGDAVARQREGYKLHQLRYEAGEDSALDLRQLEAELAGDEAQLPRLDRQRAETERALALLLGRSPRALIEQGIARPHPAPAALAAVSGLPAGLPSNLLLRRPDLAAAEARLRAAGARVEVARAAYLPSISLTGALGQRSSDLGTLLDGRSLVWNLLASLTQPIWNAGRLDAQSAAARARQQLAEIDYRDSVAQAFREAGDALGAYSETLASLDSGRRRSEALQRAAELTGLRYRGGEASLLQVIEAERAALVAQAQLAQTRGALVSAQATVFRALGGGWKVAPKLPD
jgi:multidrug efflux system outer membrane protein